MFKINSINKLIHELSQFPGVGTKSASRLTYHLLKHSDHSERLVKAIEEVIKSVHLCPHCFMFTDEPICWFCQDPLRKADGRLCVVEEPMDILGIESSGVFKGRYHVLHGSISPLEGVSPDDLYISELINRIDGDGIKEIIFALDADLEGDTTILYLTKLLENSGVKTTRIAHGVPIGGDIDYIDYRTIARALENRVEI